MPEDSTGTEIAERLMTRPDGATMDEMVAATGGPQYNVLKLLEARGYGIRKVKDGRATRYFATPPAAPSCEATLTSKGQVTLPKQVRKLLRVGDGDKIKFTIEGGNRIVVTRSGASLSDLFGILGKPPRRATLEEMDDTVRQGAVRRYLRSIR